MVSLALVLFSVGLAHGFGADHVVALLTLVARRGPAGAVAVALRFGLGHVAVCLPLAVLGAATGSLLPPAAGALLEAVGGFALVALGLLTLRDLRADRHHALETPGGAAHAAVARSVRAPLLVGGLFALGGLRAVLVAVAPAASTHRVGSAALLVAFFGLGVAVSTVVCAVGSARLVQSPRLRRLVPLAAAWASVIVGGAVVISNGMVALS